MAIRFLLPAFAVLWIASPAGAQSGLQGKQAAAPPAEILAGHLHVPEPWQHPDRIQGNLLPFEQGPKGWFADVWVPAGEVLIVPLGIDRAPQHWSLSVNGSAPQSVAALEAKGLVQIESLEATDGWTAIAPDRLRLRFERGVQLRLFEPRAHAWTTERPHVLVQDAGPWQLVQHLSSNVRVAGEPIEVSASLRGGTGSVRVLQAEADFAWGSHSLAAPLTANSDNTWSVAFPAEAFGDVQVALRLVFVDSEGRRWQRASLQSFDVDAVVFASTGPVICRADEPGVTVLELPLVGFAPEADKAHLAAEVWAMDEQGAWQPAVWLARQLPLATDRAGQSFELELDHRWLDEAGLRAPWELRNVRLQDPDGWNVWWQQDVWPVLDAPMASPVAATGDRSSRPTGIFFQNQSVAPAPALGTDRATQPKFGLMLIHGWCSGGGVWAPSQFDGPLLIHHDPNANRTYDEFAQLLGQLGANNESFGTIGHSQGGNAALHLSTYYVSGLDRAKGPRRMQSLASPYQGTPLASLGFFLCGTNNDMTPGSSASWLANIPMGQRSEVYYYTTSNAGSACQFLTNPFLTNPEDGTVEQSRGQLPGANNMGHVTGWCHTTSMSEPAGYTDTARNAVMNAQAAR